VAGERGRSSGAGQGRAPGRDVVSTPRRPWGLIAGAAAVVLFAVAVLTYAVTRPDRADAQRVSSPDEIEGVTDHDYAPGTHTTEPVAYTENPPVGGPHDPVWADCTGAVYAVEIRHENAVHSLEHGAVWVTYDPEQVDADGADTLAGLVEGRPGVMLSPDAGQERPIAVQAWGHQLFVDSPDDPRIWQFVDLMVIHPEFTPEPGAPCDSPSFLADPRVAPAG
jgi:hypothetical protein